MEIPLILREVTEYQMHCLTCPRCREATIGTLPEGVTASAFGSRLHALVALLTGRYRQSKRMVSEFLGEERELRPAVRMRKLSFGTDSATGSRFFERIMTVVMTLRRHKRALLNWAAEAYEAFRLRRLAPSPLPQPP